MQPTGLFVGQLTIDIQYALDAFPEPNSKNNAHQLLLAAGGPATNAAIAFSHLGGASRLAARVGKGPFTSFIHNELSTYHVDLLDCSTGGDVLPPISSIITTPKDGLRTVIAYSHPSRPQDAYPIQDSLSEQVDSVPLDGVNIVLLDGLNMEVCIAVAERAHAAHIPTVLDGGSWKEGTDRLLPHVDIAICSENFRPPPGAEGQSVLAFLTKEGLSLAAITRGEKSILYGIGDGCEHEIAVPVVQVVDTLGAGDVLHGAFCYHYAVSRDFVQSLTEASRVATRACQSLGTRRWMNDAAGTFDI